MRLARLGPIGSETPVALYGNKTLDLRSITSDIDGPFLAGGGPQRVREAIARGDLPAVDTDGQLRIGAPIARPSAVVCVGMNYAAHAAESGSPPPQQPIIFLKPPNTVVGPNDAITIPPGSLKTDWEVELGVVIGRQTSYLESPEQSLDHVAGFVLCNDLSERHHQLEVSGGQWSKGKAAPGFTPCGPWLATPEEVDHGSLGLHSWVNGDKRQSSTTSDMIFSVETLVWDLSQYMTLEPGDLVLTGTPAGVALSGKYPYLVPGDVIEIEIDGLGRQHQNMIRHAKEVANAN